MIDHLNRLNLEKIPSSRFVHYECYVRKKQTVVDVQQPIIFSMNFFQFVPFSVI